MPINDHISRRSIHVQLVSKMLGKELDDMSDIKSDSKVYEGEGAGEDPRLYNPQECHRTPGTRWPTTHDIHRLHAYPIYAHHLGNHPKR